MDPTKYELVYCIDSVIKWKPYFDLSYIVANYVMDDLLEFDFDSVPQNYRPFLFVSRNSVSVTTYNEKWIKILSKQSFATCRNFAYSVMSHSDKEFGIGIEKSSQPCYWHSFLRVAPKSIVTFLFEFKDSKPSRCSWYVTLPGGTKWVWIGQCILNGPPFEILHCSSCFGLSSIDTSSFDQYFPILYVGYVPQVLTFVSNPVFDSANQIADDDSIVLRKTYIGAHRQDKSCGPCCSHGK
jgi:hypothetical protein